ncbi:hypothetical protein KL905_004231 [Ogataea polymorpha]|uniref:FAD/NAD(P)-binding domain-containing protein n=1 Tax=Ogataea polymorpha TaxID=460523 RepID=A0A1B7SKE9_9ASCO|nr:uncharacterized protein OGAPODRAFT_16363 [Ogataea polymorpha]KAG7878428.1 hypothetical protein KL937_003670 [Ogataea polymorpha]KAG7890372.1 hypothetical protein KL908_004209 [Ogataea polymorpha]KAG7899061.1 hypothetical protein KL935_004069 [Ogataea polymorpha]KAG7903631.1 hypothetical protein KL907_003658 [Ogataea polymorpha]KAG7907246.1 hypothetical protein KL906_003933 [Ogataea polymorpha]
MSQYHVIVIGGSASGLQACLTFGRAYLNVLCIDSGYPCNRYAKESHNFLTHDGSSPAQIIAKAKEQLQKYPTIKLMEGTVRNVCKDVSKEAVKHPFRVEVDSPKNGTSNSFMASRVLFASGLNDNVDKIPIENIEKFWGNYVIHCPFCHGTEFRNGKTGIYYTNALHLKFMLPTLHNWSQDIAVICPDDVYGSLEADFVSAMQQKSISLHKGRVVKLEPRSSEDGRLGRAILDDGTAIELDVLYTIPPSTINNKEIITKLGVELDEMGLIKVSPQQKTNVEGVFAIGDNTTRMRALAFVVGQGMLAASSICHEILHERWNA